MITVQKKLVVCAHGTTRLKLPAKFRILGVGNTATSGAIPLYVEVDDTHELYGFVGIEICMTNKRRPDNVGTYIGTCEIDSMNAAHVYQAGVTETRELLTDPV